MRSPPARAAPSFHLHCTGAWGACAPRPPAWASLIRVQLPPAGQGVTRATADATAASAGDAGALDAMRAFVACTDFSSGHGMVFQLLADGGATVADSMLAWHLVAHVADLATAGTLRVAHAWTVPLATTVLVPYIRLAQLTEGERRGAYVRVPDCAVVRFAPPRPRQACPPSAPSKPSCPTPSTPPSPA